MTIQRSRANTLTLPVVPRRKALTGNDEFVHENDYDMTTVAGRIAWFCDQFEVERPTLELDPDCSDDEEAILLTDELVAWCDRSGISFDFAFVGGVKACVACYRAKLLSTREITETMSHMEPEVAAAFTCMIKAVVQHGLPIEEANAAFDKVIKDWRTTA